MSPVIQDFLSIGEYEPDQLQEMLDLSEKLHTHPEPRLNGKNILFAFEKPSLRTKVGTEVAINHLGGCVVHVEADVLFGSGVDPVFGCRETMTDTMKNVSQWCDAIFSRVFRHETLVQMAGEADIPIVNALCDRHHPMQAMADLYTIREQAGESNDLAVTFVGDANNVAWSLIEILLKFGYEARFAGPAGYYWSREQLAYFTSLEKRYGGRFCHSEDPAEMVRAADVIYTDTFVSMGEEDQMRPKLKAFASYQVNGSLYKMASESAAFMHCLPAHRGIEVTDDVIDNPNSWIYHQARNRMVVSKGVFATVIG